MFKTNSMSETLQSIEEDDFVSQAFKKARLDANMNIIDSHVNQYMDTSFIPPTSNICERFFSKSKVVFSDLRKSLDSETLEAILFLKVNSAYWDETTVSKALQSLPQ
jgi:hypothetical protein